MIIYKQLFNLLSNCYATLQEIHDANAVLHRGLVGLGFVIRNSRINSIAKAQAHGALPYAKNTR